MGRGGIGQGEGGRPSRNKTQTGSRSGGRGVPGWGNYKHGNRPGSAAPFPSRVILLPAAAPTVPGPAAPSTAATNAAAILRWPAAATTAASALCACACAATLSGPVCDAVLQKTEGRVVARARGSQPSSKDAGGAGPTANGKHGEGRVRIAEGPKFCFPSVIPQTKSC